MEKQLIEESPDGVATLTFNRPDRLNALLTINSNGRRVRCALVCGRLAEFVLAQLSGAHDARRRVTS